MDEMDEWFNGKSTDNHQHEPLRLWQEFQNDVKQLDFKVRALKNNHKKIKIHSLNNEIPLNSIKQNVEIQKFDYKVKRKINREKLPIDATIDLHGLSIKQAEQATIEFIKSCYTQQKIYLLIITGKGNIVNNDNTIRCKFVDFIHDPAIVSLVVSYVQAGRNHGYQGAYYVVLRRNK